MKRFLLFILISFVTLQFFAPFSINLRGEIVNKTAEASLFMDNYDEWNTASGFKDAFSSSLIQKAGSQIDQDGKAKVNLLIRIDTGAVSSEDAEDDWRRVRLSSAYTNDFYVVIKESGTGKTGYLNITEEMYSLIKGVNNDDFLGFDELPAYVQTEIIAKKITPMEEGGLSELSPNSSYIASLYYKAVSSVSRASVPKTTVGGEHGENLPIKANSYENNSALKNYYKIGETSFTTVTVDQTTEGDLDSSGSASEGGRVLDVMPKCGVTKIGGCVAQVFYYMVFKPTSFLFGLAGKAMDFTLMYSLSDSSYRTPFVSEGWKVARDLCNMFFIFILLYIAFMTILDAGGAKNKSTVINVVIIGLVINFSLFATHLIIDASNILARVFYNPKVIVVGPKDNSNEIKGEVDKDFKHIKISEAVVSKVNPQELLSTKSSITETLQSKSLVQGEEENSIDWGSFTVITILASIVNIVGMMAFLSIALAFVGRVVGLWVAMVLSPVAFLTYTIPQLKNVQYIGWTKWWPETLKAAFMAPVFVFFLYIIVMFLESGLGLAVLKNTNLSGVNKMISIIIPFVIIMVLLKQAQKIATNMAGEIAGFITEKIGKPAASFVGGAALGALTGGGAMLMRGTVGKLGAGIMNSEKLKLAESKGGISGMMAKQLRNVGDFTSKKSFDIRNTSLGKAAGKELGADLGKGKTGGYAADQEKIFKNKTTRAESLKMSPSAAAEQDKKAKDWKEKYEKDYYEKRLEWEKDPHNKGKSFDSSKDKKDFEDQFKKDNGEKIKTSDEIYKERVTKYKDSESNMLGADAETTARIEKDLKEKGKKEEKKVTAHEKYKAERKKQIASETIEDATEEIEKIDQDIENNVINVLKTKDPTLVLRVEEVTKDHIKEVINDINEQIALQEAEIVKQTSALNRNPSNKTARAALMKAKKDVRKLENDTNRLSSVLSNKKKASEKITQQSNIISEQEDIINGK